MHAKYDFSGRTALVIGGTTGIGRATALAFADAGSNLYVAGLGAAEGKGLVDEVKSRYPKVGVEFAEVECAAKTRCAISTKRPTNASVVSIWPSTMPGFPARRRRSTSSAKRISI